MFTQTHLATWVFRPIFALGDSTTACASRGRSSAPAILHLRRCITTSRDEIKRDQQTLNDLRERLSRIKRALKEKTKKANIEQALRLRALKKETKKANLERDRELVKAKLAREQLAREKLAWQRLARAEALRAEAEADRVDRLATMKKTHGDQEQALKKKANIERDLELRNAKLARAEAHRADWLAAMKKKHGDQWEAAVAEADRKDMDRPLASQNLA